jgi:hypothetical protein
MPAVPFASTADRERALRVMLAIISICDRMRQLRGEEMTENLFVVSSSK